MVLQGKSSIRQKIRLIYAGGFLFLLLMVALIFVNLIHIEKRVVFYDVISRFLETTLEIRRFEKNFFLYRRKEDFDEAMGYIRDAEALIQQYRHEFDSPAFSFFDRMLGLFGKAEARTDVSGRTSGELLALLGEYRGLLERDFQAPSPSKSLEEAIRLKGRALTDIAEDMVRAENVKIQGMLAGMRKGLVAFASLFFVGSVLIARLISQWAIKPLKELENTMTKIASGRFERLSAGSKHAEIVSLNRAFNRMIQELFAQRDIIRSEKLTSLGTMLAGIAHEINNPLSNISTSAQILAEEMKDTKDGFQRELIEQVIRETDRARDIVRSVLEFTRDKDFKKEEVHLLSALRETLRFIRTDMPTHITIAMDVPDGLTLLADKQKLQHVFLNLFRNAIDAIPDDGLEGKIVVEARRKGEREVEIRFSDTGQGIPRDILDRIFDPFFTTKDVGRGTGLGLYVTHEIIRQHGGTIDVTSQPGAGTTFTIKLPLQGDGDGKQGQAAHR